MKKLIASRFENRPRLRFIRPIPQISDVLPLLLSHLGFGQVCRVCKTWKYIAERERAKEFPNVPVEEVSKACAYLVHIGEENLKKRELRKYIPLIDNEPDENGKYNVKEALCASLEVYGTMSKLLSRVHKRRKENVPKFTEFERRLNALEFELRRHSLRFSWKGIECANPKAWEILQNVEYIDTDSVVRSIVNSMVVKYKPQY